MVALKALSLSGRFSVMVRICSATSYLIVSYAMGVSFLVFFILVVIPGRSEATSPESITTIVSMDSGPAPYGASRNDGENYFLGGLGQGRCATRRPSNALDMAS